MTASIELTTKAGVRINVNAVSGAGGGGGGVTAHSDLTGLATGDDHPQYQRSEAFYTSSASFTITDQSVVITAGSAVTLPDAEGDAGRLVGIGAAAQTVTISPAGTDTMWDSPGSPYSLPSGNGITFVSVEIGGAWGWAIYTRNGPAFDMPAWFSQSVAAGEVLRMGASAPEWTNDDPGAYDFLSGSGWTDDVPVVIACKNTSAGTITKGQAVYVTGTVGSTSVVEVALADCDDASKMPAIGLAESTMAVNATGYVVVTGVLSGVDTSGYSVNSPLYVSTTAGNLTATRPTGASELVQNIGRVIRVQSSTGEILVLGPGRTNDVPNAIDGAKLTDGTVTSAKITDGTIVNEDISASAAIATSKISGLATVATSGSGSDITSGTVAVARLGAQAPPTPLPYASNDWVPLWGGTGTGTGGTALAGTPSASNGAVRYQPVWIGQTVSLVGLGIDVTAANAGASAVVRLGLYADSAGRPGTVVVDAGTASLGTAVAKELTFSSVALSPGWYWLAIAAQSLDTSGTNPAFRNAANIPLAPRTSVPSASTTQVAVFTSSGVTGAFAASPTVSTSTTNVVPFMIWGKFA